MRVSACMIAKDEELIIGTALGSLAGRVDEIVVVDNGSSDRTAAVAADAGARVFSHAGDLSSARNRALAEAGGRWRLMIDADEEVDGATWASFLSFLEAGNHPRGLVRVVSETANGLVGEWITRACTDDPAFHYEGAIHEQLVGPGPGARTGLVLRHSGYRPEVIARKAARNERLLRDALRRDPGDPYLAYQLARTMLVTKRYADAVALFVDAARTASPTAAYLPPLACDLGYALRAAGRAREALAQLTTFQSRFADFTDLFFVEGLCRMDLGQASEMCAAFRRCLELGEPTAYPTVEGVGTYRAHYNLGLYFELAGDPRAARRHYEQAVSYGAELSPAAGRLKALGA